MILQGHVLDKLAEMEAETVSCCVTSPPYWSLRKYDAGDVVWGGEAGCEHEWGTVSKGGAAVEGYAGKKKWQHSVNGRDEAHPEARHRVDNPDDWTRITRETSTCALCGAWRGQYGLEPTPELYVEHTLDVLRAIRRVLRSDGVVWWNIGDGYSSGGSGQQSDTATRGEHLHIANSGSQAMPPYRGLPPKNLVLMPSRVALAAQADGWWVRSVIVWSKPNAMPESTKDRPTTAHEYVLMLTRSATYWYDQEAVREAHGSTAWAHQLEVYERRHGAEKDTGMKPPEEGVKRFGTTTAERYNNPAGRNMRSVWEFPTAQTPEAHFATFPEELPRRAIEASCPREICAKCGTARVRVVETDTPQHEGYERAEQPPRAGRLAEKRDRLRAQGRSHDNPFQRDTTGWTSCACEEPDYQPGIVLDPFAGIGTTGVVAKRLGRQFVGIELSEKYAEMARAKLAMWWRRTEMVAAETPDGQVAFPEA